MLIFVNLQGFLVFFSSKYLHCIILYCIFVSYLNINPNLNTMKKNTKKAKNVNKVYKANEQTVNAVNESITETGKKVKTFIKVGFENPENDKTIFVKYDVYKTISEKFLRQKYFWPELSATWHAAKTNEFIPETGFLASEVKPVLSVFFEIFKRYKNQYIEILDGDTMPALTD